MKFLIDTCILAQIQNPTGDSSTKEAFATIPDEALFLSVLTIGELTNGVARLPAGRRKQQLAEWLQGLEDSFDDRLICVDKETRRLWGEISARAMSVGRSIPAADGLLAATAIQHSLHLITHNIRHFQGSGALIFDPRMETYPES